MKTKSNKKKYILISTSTVGIAAAAGVAGAVVAITQKSKASTKTGVKVVDTHKRNAAEALFKDEQFQAYVDLLRPSFKVLNDKNAFEKLIDESIKHFLNLKPITITFTEEEKEVKIMKLTSDEIEYDIDCTNNKNDNDAFLQFDSFDLTANTVHHFDLDPRYIQYADLSKVKSSYSFNENSGNIDASVSEDIIKLEGTSSSSEQEIFVKRFLRSNGNLDINSSDEVVFENFRVKQSIATNGLATISFRIADKNAIDDNFKDVTFNFEKLEDPSVLINLDELKAEVAKINFINYISFNPLKASTNLTATDFKIAQFKTAFPGLTPSFDFYTAPTNDNQTGDMRIRISKDDEPNISTIVSVDVPFTVSYNQDRTNSLPSQLTYPVDRTGMLTGKYFEEFRSSTDKAASLKDLLVILKENSFVGATFDDSNINISAFTNTDKTFTVSFKAAFGAATAKDVSLSISVRKSIDDVDSDHDAIDLDAFVKANLSKVTLTHDQTKPNDNLSVNEVVWNLSSGYSIDNSSFHYTKPTGDEKKGTAVFNLIHGQATQEVTVNVPFLLSPNQFKTNALVDLHTGDSTTASKIKIDDILDFSTSPTVEKLSSLLATINDSTLTGATLSSPSIATFGANVKSFDISFQAKFGTATAKTVHLLIVTEHDKNYYDAHKDEADLHEWIQDNSSKMILKNTISLDNPYVLVNKESFAIAPFDATHTLKEVVYTKPESTENDGHALLTIQYKNVVESVNVTIHFTKTMREFDALTLPTSIDFGSATRHSRFINKDEIKAGFAEHSKMSELLKVALQGANKLPDDERNKEAAMTSTTFDPVQWEFSNVRFDETTYDDNAASHHLTVTATSKSGFSKDVSITIYPRLGLNRLFAHYINHQDGPLQNNEWQEYGNRQTIDDKYQSMLGSLQKTHMTQKGLDAAQKLREMMGKYPEWAPQGDSIVDGFNAVRFVLWREANGDLSAKQIFKDFCDDAWGDLRKNVNTVMAEEREKVVKNILSVSGHPEFQNVTLSNIKFNDVDPNVVDHSPFAENTKVLKISFDAKVGTSSKAFTFTINLDDSVTQAAIKNEPATLVIWGNQNKVNSQGAMGYVFDGYRIESVFEQSELDKLLNPIDTDASNDINYDNLIKAKQYSFNDAKIKTDSLVIKYSMDSVNVSTVVRFNWLNGIGRRNVEVKGSLSETPNQRLTNNLPSLIDLQTPQERSLYKVMTSTEIGKSQLIYDLASKSDYSNLAGANLSEIVFSEDNATNSVNVSFKAAFGLAATKNISLHFKITSSDNNEMSSFATNYLANFDSYGIANIDSFTNKIFANEQIGVSDINPISGSTITDIVVSKPQYSISKEVYLSFNVQKGGATIHCVKKIQLSKSLDEYKVSQLQENQVIASGGTAAPVTGYDLSVITENWAPHTYYQFAQMQVNDWLEGRKELFISSNGIDNQDSSWMHGDRVEDPLIFLKHPMDRSVRDMDWAHMRPMRLGFLASIFAQERQQSLEYFGPQASFDLHEWQKTLDVLAGKETPADYLGMAKAEWGAASRMPKRAVPGQSEAGRLSGELDNFLAAYTYVVDDKVCDNGLATNFVEGLLSASFTLYDTTDGSTSGGHRTSLIMATNDRMGWTLEVTGNFPMLQVEYARRYSETYKSYQDALEKLKNPTQFTATDAEIANVRTKYPWSSSDGAVFAGLHFDAYIAKMGIIDFLKFVASDFINGNHGGFDYWQAAKNTFDDESKKETVIGNIDAFLGGQNFSSLTDWVHNTSQLANNLTRLYYNQNDASRITDYTTLGGGYGVAWAFWGEFNELKTGLTSIEEIKNHFNSQTGSGPDQATKDLFAKVYDGAFGRLDDGGYVLLPTQPERDVKPYDINGGGSLITRHLGYDEFPEDLYELLPGE